jgi:hypothetical protein
MGLHIRKWDRGLVYILSNGINLTVIGWCDRITAS